MVKHQLFWRLIWFASFWLICKMNFFFSIGLIKVKKISLSPIQISYFKESGPWQCRTRRWSISTRADCLGCLIWFYFWKKNKSCLFVLKAQWQNEREKKRTTCWVTPQKASVTRTGATNVAGAQTHGPPLSSECIQKLVGKQNRQLELVLW